MLTRYPTLLADEIGKLVAAWQAAPEQLSSETAAPIFNVAHVSSRAMARRPAIRSSPSSAAGLDHAINKFILAAGNENKARLRDEVAVLQAKK